MFRPRDVAEFVILTFGVAFGAVQDTGDHPRLTSDKKPLPDAVPRASAVKLPIIGTKLDALPEEACGKVWELDTDIDFVNDSRHAFTETGVDMTGFNYLGDGVAGYTRTALDVENGRVRKMMLFRPGLTYAVVNATLAKIAADTTERPVRDGNETIKFRMKGIHYYERPVGRWEKVTPATEHPVMGENRVERTEEKRTSGPAAIEIGIDDDDWQALNVCRNPAMLTAIQDGHLVKGMRPVEAYLAMKGHKLYRQKIGDEYVWTWSSKTMEVQGYSTVSDEYGTMTTVHYAKEEHPFAKATFVNGVVDSIEDEDTLLMPPEK